MHISTYTCPLYIYKYIYGIDVHTHVHVAFISTTPVQ